MTQANAPDGKRSHCEAASTSNSQASPGLDLSSSPRRFPENIRLNGLYLSRGFALPRTAVSTLRSQASFPTRTRVRAFSSTVAISILKMSSQLNVFHTYNEIHQYSFVGFASSTFPWGLGFPSKCESTLFDFRCRSIQ